MAAYIQENADTPGSCRGPESAGKKAFEEARRMRAAAGGSGAGALCCQDRSPPQRDELVTATAAMRLAGACWRKRARLVSWPG
jgi:hypothetical protein